VVDSTSNRPVAGARVELAGTTTKATTDRAGRFTLAGVIPGEYTLTVGTPSLDSIGATSQTSVTALGAADPLQIRVPTGAQLAGALCVGAGPGSSAGTGAIVGDVRDAKGGAPGESQVTAEWDDYAVRQSASGPIVVNRPHALQTTSDAGGEFTLCGVPLDVALTFRAKLATVRSAPVSFRLSTPARVGRVRLTIDPALSAVAAFAGAVLADSTNEPLAGAEVSLPDLGLRALTNDQGVFRIAEVPAGDQHVVVRRMGYAPLDQRVTFAPNAVVTRRVLLNRVVMLDSVIVEASSVAIPEFEEHRKLGLGHFMTRAELAKRNVSHLSEILETVPGLKVIRDRSNLGSAYAVRSRGATSLSQVHGTSIDECPSSVYIDGWPVYGKTSKEGGQPFDVNLIPPNMIEAIEYYSGASETPAKYSGLNSTCGVLVIWTRRTP
ncbi:MAG TPA: carboxypeptidase-like regulatory domain-containing protein, partial [Gemmatimonadaceae bacterium]|nr:carboxypeptidase-like regulatory domain-containing protein [Gemmatimonadaceae bacterium]